MSKIKAEDCYAISTQFLKKHGYFDSKTYTSGSVTWSFGEKVISEVGVTVDTRLMTVAFDYRTRDRYSSEEWKVKHFVVNLRTTPCNAGGKRYWFDCRFCRKRVGTLYLYYDNDFACRHCLGLTYKSRMTRKRFSPFTQVFKNYDLEKQIDDLRVKYYKGRPTKKYISLMKKANSCLPDDAIAELEKLCREIMKVSM